jgi:hypothetical protein
MASTQLKGMQFNKNDIKLLIAEKLTEETFDLLLNQTNHS